MKSRFIDRLHDRLWQECSSRKTTDTLGEPGQAGREVEETLGPSDGRHHARRILTAAPELLHDARMRSVNAWGDPVLWPALLLGTPSPYSPTTLRYLSHALWLRDHGLVKQSDTIAEIGVGYGWLAAMTMPSPRRCKQRASQPGSIQPATCSARATTSAA